MEPTVSYYYSNLRIYYNNYTKYLNNCFQNKLEKGSVFPKNYTMFELVRENMVFFSLYITCSSLPVNIRKQKTIKNRQKLKPIYKKEGIDIHLLKKLRISMYAGLVRCQRSVRKNKNILDVLICAGYCRCKYYK